MDVELASNADDADIDEFVSQHGCGLIHYTPAYRRFLSLILPAAKAKYLLARQNGRIVGLLPGFQTVDADLGTVSNSLPFFGSHGCCVVDQSVNAEDQVSRELLEANRLLTHGNVSVTLIESPLHPIQEDAARNVGLSVVDDRIGQFTRLPQGSPDVRTALFAKFHQKTRNAIRKGAKIGQRVEQTNDPDALAWLQAVHYRSISAMNGVSKSTSVFDAVAQELGLDRQARLYVGSHEGVRVSGLLVLLHQKTVEYFTPVVEETHKETQALSDLIFKVMVDLALQGYEVWNWGGTWRSQDGVYRFKKRWGADDKVYRYFNRVSPTFLDQDPQELRAKFPYFYLFKY